MSSEANKFLIGVDVGTGSVRAALFTLQGRRESARVIPISVINPAEDFYEQDSNEIWTAVCG